MRRPPNFRPSCATTVVVNLPIELQSLEATLEKVAALAPRVVCEDTFEGLVDRPMLKERPDSRIYPTHSRSSARLKDIMRDQIADIPALLKDAVL